MSRREFHPVARSAWCQILRHTTLPRLPRPLSWSPGPGCILIMETGMFQNLLKPWSRHIQLTTFPQLETFLSAKVDHNPPSKSRMGCLVSYVFDFFFWSRMFPTVEIYFFLKSEWKRVIYQNCIWLWVYSFQSWKYRKKEEFGVKQWSKTDQLLGVRSNKCQWWGKYLEQFLKKFSFRRPTRANHFDISLVLITSFIIFQMRRKHSLESSYSANKDRHNKQGTPFFWSFLDLMTDSIILHSFHIHCQPQIDLYSVKNTVSFELLPMAWLSKSHAILFPCQ